MQLVKIQSILWIAVVPVLVDPIEAISKVFPKSYLKVYPVLKTAFVFVLLVGLEGVDTEDGDWRRESELYYVDR